MKVFVIIVTYNGKHWYDRCFSSLRQSNLPLEVVVVDNASSDDTAAYIREHYPEIYLIESDKNLGFGQANNNGIRYAMSNGANYVFLLNQDAWIEPNTLDELVKVSENDSSYGILSPIHLNAEKNAVEKGLLVYISNNQITDSAFVSDLYIGNLLKAVYQTTFVNAAGWLLPKKTLDTVGGFDPIFFHYGEDDNYLQRTIYHGLKIGICPRARMVHDTERRLPNAGISDNFMLTILDISTNILNPISVEKLILVYLIRGFKSLLKGNFNNFKRNLNATIYLQKEKSRIKNSVSQNKQIKASWL